MVIDVRKILTSGLKGSFWPERGLRQPSKVMESFMILGGHHMGVYISEKSSSSTLKIYTSYYINLYFNKGCFLVFF